MKTFKKSILAPVMIVLSVGMSLLSTNIAFALSTPMTPACLGGTLVKSQKFSDGTLRIYRSCGAYYAQFGSNGVRRTFKIYIVNVNNTDYSSGKSFTNVYGGWTDLIPGACVYAYYVAGGSTLAGFRYGC